VTIPNRPLMSSPESHAHNMARVPTVRRDGPSCRSRGLLLEIIEESHLASLSTASKATPGAASALVVASGFQRCHVPVHKDNILAGFGRTRVKIVVIEKERSRSRRKRQDEVRNSARPVPLFQ